MNKWLALIAFSVFLLVPVGALEVFAQSDDASIDSSVFTPPPTISETPPILGVVTASATPIDIGDFSGGETVIGFDSLLGVPSPGPFSIGDVTFSEFSSGFGSPGWRLLTGFLGTPDPQLTDNRGISIIRLDFSSPVNRVGMIVGIGPADYEVRFFNNALTLIETVPISIPTFSNAGFFAGIQSTELISRVEIVELTDINTRVAGIDDVRFELVDITVGGEFLQIDNTALLLAGAQSFSWMIPVVLSVLGIGLFVVSRKSE